MHQHLSKRLIYIKRKLDILNIELHILPVNMNKVNEPGKLKVIRLEFSHSTPLAIHNDQYNAKKERKKLKMLTKRFLITVNLL